MKEVNVILRDLQDASVVITSYSSSLTTVVVAEP